MSSRITQREKRKILRLTHKGLSQKEIASRVRRHRSAVYRIQKRAGLAKPYRAPRLPLTFDEKRELRKLFKRGYGCKTAARELNLREHAVRIFAESLGHHGRKLPRHNLSPVQMRRLDYEIMHRHDRAYPLSVKYNTSYDWMLWYCKKVLRCERLVSGRPRLPLDSEFPQRWPRVLGKIH